MNEPAAEIDPSVRSLFRAARWLLFATLLVPVALSPGFFFPYVTLRAVLFRVLVEAGVAIALYLALRREVALAIKRDAVFWALLTWVAANLLAGILGLSPMRSFFGDLERMGGVWFWVHMLAFYVVLRTFLTDSDWRAFFLLAVAIAATVAVVGLALYWVPAPAMGLRGVDAGVTIGNSGLLAAYLLANIGFCALLAARRRIRFRWGYLATGLLLLVALVFTGNRSSTLALFVGASVGFTAYALWSKSLRGWRTAVALLPLASALSLPFVSSAPWALPLTSRVPVLSRLSMGVDSSRVVQWQAAMEAIRDRPLLGVGPENYQTVWSRFYHPEMHRFHGDSRWDRAHNAYLDAFATAGIFGFLSLIALFFSLGWACHRAARLGDAHGGTYVRGAPEAVAIGFFAAYAFFLIFWFFDLNSSMLWVALAAFVASRSTGAPLVSFGARREKRWQTTIVLGAGAAAFSAVVYVHGFATLRMARTLDGVRLPGRSADQLLRDYESVFRSPAPVTQHVFPMYADHLASMRPRFPAIKADASSAALFDRAFILAIEEFERQAAQDPHNERVTVQHARVLMTGARYYDSSRLYASAVRRLERAVELAPRRVPTLVALGTAYLNGGRARDALATFQRAYALYPGYTQTRTAMALAFLALGQPQDAAGWIESAIALGYTPDGSTVAAIAESSARAGNASVGGNLIRSYLFAKYGPTFMWAGRGRRADASDYRLANRASELFAQDAPRSSDILRPADHLLCTSAVPLDSVPAAALKAFRPRAPDCYRPYRATLAY